MGFFRDISSRKNKIGIMILFKRELKTAIGFLFRLFPLSTETGLKIFGNADENSPVFVTANFDLTVKRVEKHLKTIDCYLLVAPTKGINVWCAAGGDFFNAHSVISVVRTSTISKRVKHRKLILPQLSASGIDTKLVETETGWRCQFGPVYAKDIAPYVKNNFKKTEKMRRVEYNLLDRLDAGIGCTFIGYILFAAVLLIVELIWGISWFFEFTVLGWSLLLLMYSLYPYTPGKTGWQKVLSWEITLAIGLSICLPIFWGKESFPYVPKLIASAMIITMLIGMDFGGAAPDNHTEFDPFMAKLGFSNWGQIMDFDNTRIRLIRGIETIRLNDEKCTGCGMCYDICPVGVYKIVDEKKKSIMDDLTRCTACSACVTQCPTDALYLDTGIKPQTYLFG